MSPSTGTGRELAQRLQRPDVGAAIVENPEHPGQRQPGTRAGLEKSIDGSHRVVRHDLRQEELRVERAVGEEAHLAIGVGIGIGPSAEGQVRFARADGAAKLPCVLDRAGWTDVLVAAQHDQRLEVVVPCALGVGEAVLERVLRRQKRHHQVARDAGAEVGDQVPEVVLLLQPDGAVGEKDRDAPPREATDCVVGVNPRVHALRSGQLRSRGPKLRGDDRRVRDELIGERQVLATSRP
jgi:hypothetical protein